MAAKKTAAEQGLQQKMKVLAKLFEAGCKTEKDLKALTLPTILKIPDVTVECIILTVNNTFIDAGGYAHEQL